MSDFTSLFGGGSGSFYNQRLILESKTFTAPKAGKYLFTAFGGGGGGKSGVGRGGGAGGMSQKLVDLAEGAEITIVVGAGGAANSNGGTTTVVGTGINLSAGGGVAGNTSSGGEGGTATGGDINYTGGATTGAGGGAAPVYGTPATNTFATGCGTGGPHVTYPGALGSQPMDAQPFYVSTTQLDITYGGLKEGFAFGRLLLPTGGRGTVGISGGGNAIGPGAGSNAPQTPATWYGGGYGGGGTGGTGGLLGGGGGQGTTGGQGGVGGVVIEWFTA